MYPRANKFQEIVFSGPRTEEAVKKFVMDNLRFVSYLACMFQYSPIISDKHNAFSDEEQRLLGDVI